MRPRFSATITSSWSASSSSIVNFMVSGDAVNRFEERTSLLFRYTEIVSSSISPLSYSLTVTSGLLTVRLFINSFCLVFNTAGFGKTVVGLVLMTGLVVVFDTVSLGGFTVVTGVVVLVTGLLVGFVTVVLVATGCLFTTTGFFTGVVTVLFFTVSFLTGGWFTITGLSFPLFRRNGSSLKSLVVTFLRKTLPPPQSPQLKGLTLPFTSGLPRKVPSRNSSRPDLL